MINYDLTKIKAIIFDVDGVLSKQTVQMSENGDPLRTVNIRDGYAIQLAVKLGLKICIITGAKTQNIRKRYEGLGVTDIYLASSVKIKDYEDYIWRNRLKDEEVMYMGDDIPDIEILRRAGCPVCPRDAAPDVCSVCGYISSVNGGEGCARDVIEQVLRARGRWLEDDTAFGW